jgi:hypothetical protein
MKEKINIVEAIIEWTEQNTPLGIELGYPECCIVDFCTKPPLFMELNEPTKDDIKQYHAGCIDGKFTGFIPCKEHAEQILNNEITIDSLISKNRNKMFPKFPNA